MIWLSVLSFVRANLSPLLVLGALIGVTVWGGIQTYRLQGTRAELKAIKVERATQEREDAAEVARERAFNEYNRKRTNEDYRASLARAAAASVRIPEPAPVAEAPTSGGSPNSSACFDGGILSEELGRVAKEGEALGAAYRACRAWALGVGSGGAAEGSPWSPGGDGVARAAAPLSP